MPDLDSMQRDKAIILSIIKYILLAALIAALIYFGFWLFWILLPFVFGYVLAQVANRLASIVKNVIYRLRHRSAHKAADLKKKAMEESADASQAVPQGRRKRGTYPHGLARSRSEKRIAVIIYFLEVLGMIGLVVIIVNGGIGQLRALIGYLPELFRDVNLSKLVVDALARLSATLGGLISASVLEDLQNSLLLFQQHIIEALPNVVTSVLNTLAKFVGYLPGILFIIIVVIMSGYYFTADSRYFYMFLRRNITSKPFRTKSIQLVNKLSATLFRVIGGYLLLLTITFLMALGGLIFIGMPYPVLVAVLVALIDLLPVLGIGTTMVPISIYMFISGNVFSGVATLVILAIMIIVRRVIEPPILGSVMRLHPLSTLLAMLIGIGIYGLGGLIIAPIIYVIMREVIIHFGLDQRLRDLFGKLLDRVRIQ